MNATARVEEGEKVKELVKINKIIFRLFMHFANAFLKSNTGKG